MADVNPNPHNDTVPPHSVTRTFDAYLTSATRPGDAAGVAVSIRAIDDPAYGSLDYGTINYVARLKLRYEENVVHPDADPNYTGVSDPKGMDIMLEDIPNSTLPAPGVTPGPAGAADLHIRELSATLLGERPVATTHRCPTTRATVTYPARSTPLVVSSEGNRDEHVQDYQATGCENLPYDPALTQFDDQRQRRDRPDQRHRRRSHVPAGSSTTTFGDRRHAARVRRQRAGRAGLSERGRHGRRPAGQLPGHREPGNGHGIVAAAALPADR